MGKEEAGEKRREDSDQESCQQISCGGGTGIAAHPLDVLTCTICPRFRKHSTPERNSPFTPVTGTQELFQSLPDYQKERCYEDRLLPVW